MAEPRLDMLPDQSETEQEVSEDLQTPEVEVVEVESPEPVEIKGNKTPDRQLYAALQEERKLRKEAQAKLNSLQSTSTFEVIEEDEPDRYTKLEREILDLKRDTLISRAPALADKRADFENYLDENPEIPLESAAKIFLAERGLLEPTVARKGLQQASGGPKTAPATGMTWKEVENLRINFPKRYSQMIQSGAIDPDNLIADK